jgi:lipid-A-disaccharide synthase
MKTRASPNILISAGEASGEMYAAQLAQALGVKTGAKMFGLGGPQMRKEGVELVAESSEVAVVGISEALHRLPAAWRILRRLAHESALRKPDLAILVDFPDFNLRLGKKLREQGVRIVYFISPQVWAWRRGRVGQIKRLVERMLVIFPFEEKFYRDAGVTVDFVGHPLVDSVRAARTPEEFAQQFGLDPKRRIVALLPGSRPREIEHNLPTILNACRGFAFEPAPQFILVVAPGLSEANFQKFPFSQVPARIVENETYNALAASDIAIVSSGTATVEAALLGAPMVVIYRVSRLTAFVARQLVRTPHIAMVNLILGRRAVPELIQDDFTAEALEAEMRRLLESADERGQMRRELAEVRARLGPGGAIERAAGIIERLL